MTRRMTARFLALDAVDEWATATLISSAGTESVWVTPGSPARFRIYIPTGTDLTINATFGGFGDLSATLYDESFSTVASDVGLAASFEVPAGDYYLELAGDGPVDLTVAQAPAATVLRPSRAGTDDAVHLFVVDADGVQVPDNGGAYDGTGGAEDLVCDQVGPDGIAIQDGDEVGRPWVVDYVHNKALTYPTGVPAQGRRAGLQGFAEGTAEVPVALDVPGPEFTIYMHLTHGTDSGVIFGAGDAGVGVGYRVQRYDGLVRLYLSTDGTSFCYVYTEDADHLVVQGSATQRSILTLDPSLLPADQITRRHTRFAGTASPDVDPYYIGGAGGGIPIYADLVVHRVEVFDGWLSDEAIRQVVTRADPTGRAGAGGTDLRRWGTDGILTGMHLRAEGESGTTLRLAGGAGTEGLQAREVPDAEP